ncbi:chemotaxis protein CheB [Acidithiobacillus thiooxidans]|uniref:chemotaxis protein CheB n=1 Tax=Acidithiobacillus thiooxidans TaxID=930 RepID=UPI0034E97747
MCRSGFWWTFAQDESSCVVFGMPKEAIKLGGVDEVVALTHIASRLPRSIEEAR